MKTLMENAQVMNLNLIQECIQILTQNTLMGKLTALNSLILPFQTKNQNIYMLYKLIMLIFNLMLVMKQSLLLNKLKIIDIAQMFANQDLIQVNLDLLHLLKLSLNKKLQEKLFQPLIILNLVLLLKKESLVKLLKKSSLIIKSNQLHLKILKNQSQEMMELIKLILSKKLMEQSLVLKPVLI